MSYRTLALLPLALGGLLCVAAAGGGAGRLDAVLAGANEAGKLLALAGCVAAAVAFDSGDYLRRAWLLMGGGYALLLGADAIARAAALHAVSLSDAEVHLARGVCIALGNASSTASIFILARAWNVAGLADDVGARAARRRFFVAGAAVALALCGSALVQDARSLARGDFGALVGIASDLGDTASLALLVPVMQTVLALRGGVLRWPWGFLAASIVCWLAYDAVTGALDSSRITAAPWVVAGECVRLLACAYGFAAGVAQRTAVAAE